MYKWYIEFTINDEYFVPLYVIAKVVTIDAENDCAFFADGVRVEVEDTITEISRLEKGE